MTNKDIKYSELQFTNKNSFTYGGKGLIINGHNKVAHLLTIHNCLDLTLRNVTFQGGNTEALEQIKRNKIPFRSGAISVFEIIDGGAVIITGKSRVLFENCKFIGNKSVMCGGAVSNQSSETISFRHCYFEGNTSGHSGSAIDNLTPGSSLIVDSCQFVDNRSNHWHRGGYPHGHISVFPRTKAVIKDSTFRGGSIPLDYDEGTNVILERNIYEGFHKWREVPTQRSTNRFIDKLQVVRKLYWVIPKTIGKVYYKVSN